MAEKQKSDHKFINLINEKRSPKLFRLIPYFIHKAKVNKFKKRIKNGSPDFDTLWAMADFIKLAEYIYFYDNSTENKEFGLYSSKNYSEGTNGFKIINDNYNITLKLFDKQKRVALDVTRTLGEKVTNSMSFKENEWLQEPGPYDELLLGNIIDIINTKILKLFDYCYDFQK